MKNLLLFCLAMALATPLCAQGEFFTPLSEKQLPNLENNRLYRTDKAWISELTDHKGIADYLARAPHETNTSAKNGQLIELPNPDGEATTFRIVRYTMIHPSVQALMPDAVTAYGVDTEGKGMRLSLSYTSTGISAMVRGGQNGRWMIDPVFAGDNRFHQSFYTKDSPATVERQCLVEDEVRNNPEWGEPLEEKILDDCRLRTHELALACTGEYFQYMVDNYGDGNNDRSANDYTTVFARVMVSINRVNQIFREDIAISFTLVNQVQADTIELLFNNASTDPYDNLNTNQLVSVNSAVTNDAIGEENYDLGHVFSTSFGGLAGPGICFDNNQADGATGLPAPETDAYDVDFVAHELGHQLGANHTFNSQRGSCSGSNRNANTGFEPGSGTTVMAYAGICTPDNVQPNSDPYFHIISLEEINDQMQLVFSNYNPSSCAVFSTGNTEPNIEAGPNYSVPLNTPFVLTAVGSDPDGGTLTYTWEQYFTGPTTALNGEPTGAETNTPLFRSLPPTTDPQRYFPALASVVNGVTTGDWESLPTTAQTLRFNVTARDGVANGGYGCPQTDFMAVTFVNTNAQFGVTTPNGGERITAGSMSTITWNDAGTRANGINCANVDILLSTDGGLTYPQTLATATPNDGSLSVMMPATTTSTARIMIRCSDNIFFDISNNDFSLESTAFTVNGNLDQASVCSSENEAVFTVDVASTQGYTGSIDLSATMGLPPGATVAFSTDPVVFNAGNANTVQTVTVTIGNLSGTTEGAYTIVVEGSDGSNKESTDLTLDYGAGPISLMTPANNSMQLVNQDVDFTFLTVAGRNRYIISFQVFRSGVNLGGGSFGTIFSGMGPGDGFSVTLSQTLGNTPGDEIRWFITASDDSNTNPDVVSCTRNYFLANVLPVNWLNFTARASGKTALLSWSVEQDALNAGFAIERTTPAINNWEQVGYTQRTGEDGIANYLFTDEQVEAGNTYLYRLRQEDVDGAISYSEIRTVTFGDVWGLVAVPNPTNDFVVLSTGESGQSKLRYTMYDPTGRKVSEGQMNNGRVRVDMNLLPAAIYQVLVTDEAGYQEVVRVVKR